ncbi:MAG TPA: lysyl oxidase family protein [Bacteriovoracaceae bacterium]|nr:lysyl oxidase family protein [Bacteriovoracaceae bacterium]
MLKNITVALALVASSTTFARTLLLPDLVTSRKNLSDNSIDRYTKPGRILLRLSNGVANIGKGRLEMRGGSVVDGKQRVDLRIFYDDGTYYSRFSGYYVFHSQHNHTHFEGFARYRLREIEGSIGVGEVVAESSKVSFCMYDEYIFDSSLDNFRNYRRYNSCGTGVQGLSVGWKDVYGKSLADQWIDITGVDSGVYWLESTADPYNRIRESNGANNTSRIKISISL